MNHVEVKRRFGMAIRQLRQERGVSQESLARKARFARSYLTGVETGDRNPTLQNISRLAEALEVPIADLFE
jgi:transcriptional regulator with XRE-family HTH domain